MIAEQRLRGGTHAEPLLELLGAAHSDPGHLGGKALDVILLLLQEALRDEQRHRHILMPQLLEAGVEEMGDVLPNGVAVRLNDHAAAHAGIIHQLRFFHDVGVPLGEILLHGSDGFDHFFLFSH